MNDLIEERGKTTSNKSHEFLRENQTKKFTIINLAIMFSFVFILDLRNKRKTNSTTLRRFKLKIAHIIKSCKNFVVFSYVKVSARAVAQFVCTHNDDRQHKA